VALATGQAWLATGNDMAGSLRIPSAFCSVVGFRPSPGRVAHGPLPLSFGMLNIDGPMARTVGDAALMLDAMVGEHVEDPISLPAPSRPFIEAVDAPRRPARIAWSPDLGLGPVDPEVRRVCEAAMARFEGLGIPVEEAAPDLSGSERCFRVLRNAQRAAAGSLLESHGAALGPEMLHYANVGLRQTAAELAGAELLRAEIYARTVAFFGTYDILACPSVAAQPFPIEQRHVMELGGTRFEEPFGWLFLTFALSITACPAISIPCGFTESGLPVGLQLVGRPRDDRGVLSAAALFEAEAGLAGLTPIEPRSPGAAALGRA
jgi:amidase